MGNEYGLPVLFRSNVTFTKCGSKGISRYKNSFTTFKIIREGAVKREEYSVLDQGAGYINVVNAYSLLQKYLKNDEQNKFETYTITSFATTQPDNKSQNLYIRDGSYLTGDEIFSFTVRRNNFLNADKFYRVYNLKSDSDWLVLVQKNLYQKFSAVNCKY